MASKFPQEARFEQGSYVVEFKRIDPKLSSYDGKPEERCRYEIRVDGEHVGFTAKRFGFGKQPFFIERVYPEHYAHVYGDRVVLSASYSNKNYELDGLVSRIIEYRFAKSLYHKLVTLEEYHAEMIAHKERQEANAIKEDQLREEWRLEREEAAKKAVAERKDTHDTLLGIRNRLSNELTNYEISTLEGLIAQYE